jgi:hypothetical protein
MQMISGIAPTGVSKNSRGLSRWRNLMPLLLAVVFMVAANPSLACMHIASLAAVDDALSKSKLSEPEQTKAMQLRATLADLLTKADRGAARDVETQIMDMLGLKLKPSRGWGCGQWVPKTP